MTNQNFVSQRPPPPFCATTDPSRLERLEPRTLLSASIYEDVNNDPLEIRPSPGLRLHDQLIFPMHTLDRGTELWTTDATAAGTKLLKDILPGINGSDPQILVPLGDEILFAGWDGKSTALWRTDGTSTGTRRIRALPDGINEATVVGDHLYFIIGRGNEPTLWRSDGTKKGTQRLIARSATRSISLPFLYKRQVRFVVHSDESDRGAVWTIDESDPARPRAARTLYPRHAILDPHVANGWIYHATDTGAIARTNLEKTEIIKDLNGKPVEYAGVEFLRTIDDTTFFLADDGPNRLGHTLWRTDGSPAGTFELNDEVDFYSRLTLLTLGDSIVLTNLPGHPGTHNLWKSDGTVAGTTAIKPGLENVHTVTRRGNHLFFFATELGDDRERYWRSDGTADGTLPIKSPATGTRPSVGRIDGASVHLGPDSGSLLAYDTPNDNDPTLLYRSKRTRNANPHDLTSVGNDLYFATTYNDEGNDHLFDPTDFAIWKKNGNEPAQRLATLPGRVAGIYPVADDRVFFTVFETDAVPGSSHHIPHGESDLWITDGTPAGTRQFTPDDSPLTTGVGPAWPDRLALVGDHLFYYLTDLNTTSGADEQTGALWASDGTPNGTHKVLDVKVLGITPAPDGDHAYFISDTQDVWRTDGNSAERVVRLDADDLAVEHLIPADGGLYFTTIDRDPNSPTGRTLWFAHENGDARKLANLDLPNDDRPFRAAHANGKLFFAYRTTSGNAALWSSDATPAGTRMIKKLSRGATAVSTITDVVTVRDHAYFVADAAEHGAELWRSDGTREGTVIVKDIHPGPTGSYPMSLTTFDGRLVFFAHDDEGRKLLWSIDGLGAEPVLLGTLPPQSADDPLTSVHYDTELTFHDDHLIAAYPHPRYGHELWQIDL